MGNYCNNLLDILGLSLINLTAIHILICNSFILIITPKKTIWKNNTYFSILFFLSFTILFIVDMIKGNLSLLSGIYCFATLVLLQICTVLGYNMHYNAKQYHILLNLTIIFLLGTFSTNNILLFYIFFESALIPMFVIIIIWGTREEKSSAAYQFFLYTILGSFCLLFGIIYLLFNKQTTNIYFTDIFQIPNNKQYILFILFFLGFAVKIPIFPFHLWLPKAHVEAPTVGSILLAGILLKLGSYGFIKFNILLFPFAINFYKPLIFTLATIGVVYTVITIFRQIHLKRIIAYSSISHMNFVTLACFSGNPISLHGGILLTLAHGLSSSGLFACVGCIYTRIKTMNILYLRSLSSIMPITALFFFLFTLSNIGFPPTLNFVAELLIFIGLLHMNINIIPFLVVALILTTIVGLWIYTRIFFGTHVFVKKNKILKYSDINIIEFFCLFIILMLIIILSFFINNINIINEFWFCLQYNEQEIMTWSWVNNFFLTNIINNPRINEF